MFGLFSKPDPHKTTNECLEVWAYLTEHDKFVSAQNILKYARFLSNNCETSSEAILKLAAFKQEQIRNHNLQDYFHPAFMQVQILNDYIFTYKSVRAQHPNTASALARITSSLSSQDQEELAQYLERIVLDPIPKGPLKSLKPSPQFKSEPMKIIRECPRCSQKCRVTNQKTKGNLIEITCPTCTLRWTTLS